MELISIGKIIKAQGLKGELKVFFEEKQLARLKSIDTLFVKQKNGTIPFSVRSLRKAKDHSYYLMFEEINSRTDAELLIGHVMLADNTMFRKKEVAEGYSFTAGYTMIDLHEGELGRIEDVLQLPANDVAQLFIKEKEVLLPLNDYIVVEVNKRKKQLTVNMPKGLVKMYLEL